MKNYKFYFKILILATLAVNVKASVIEKFFCPDSESLKEGFMYTNKPGKVSLEFPRRHLAGPYVATSRFGNKSISFAGIFTYKYWRNGKLIQFENPITDTSDFLKFEIGSEHIIETVRYNPQSPSKKWNLKTVYRIKNEEELKLGKCTYSQLNIETEETIRYPDGRVKTKNEYMKYIPELMLKTEDSGDITRKITSIRKRKPSDGNDWPFSRNAITFVRKM